MKLIYEHGAILELISKMAEQLNEQLAHKRRADPLLVGIHTGGVWLARHLHAALALEQPMGSLNIAFYRDDFSRIGLHPSVQPSNLPFDIDDRHIVLVDDILYTGRTVRAALNEVFDYGRPASVTLCVLVDREEHELPIKADVVGTPLSLESGEHVKLTGPDALSLVMQKTQ